MSSDIDVTKLRRKPEAVLASLVKNSAGQVITRSACTIHTPVRFVERKLSLIGVRNYVFGWLPIILESGDYSVMNVCGRLEIKPDRVKMITIDDVDYYEFQFDAGSGVFQSDDVVQDDKIIYFIVDEMIFQAKAPWFMDYNDLGKLFDSAGYYAESRAAEVLEVVELLASVIARHKNDEGQYLRHFASTLKDKLLENAQFIPLASVHLTVTGTINRIGGNYFEPAVEGALIQPSRKADNVEKVLRA